MSNIRILLAVGDDHKKICDKYRCDKGYEVPVMSLKDDAKEAHKYHIKYIEDILASPSIDDSTKGMYTDILDYLKNCSDEEYFEFVNEGNRIEDGVAYSMNDPKGLYVNPVCGQERLESTCQEMFLSNPFILLDGTKSYVARKGDIDWAEMHCKHMDFYEKVWDMCLNGAEPSTKEEEQAHFIMKNRLQYFSRFKNAEEYARHNTCFWTYLVASEDRCDTLDGHKEGDRSWVANFYDTYIAPLPDDTLLSIYEVRLADGLRH